MPALTHLNHNLLTSGNACRGPAVDYIYTDLVLVAQAVFFLEHGQTDKITEATECFILTDGYAAGVDNC